MNESNLVKINDNGHLCSGGCDVVELAEEYGTPLYIMDEEVIRKNIREYKSVIDEEYDGNGIIFYASKAFCVKEMCRIVQSEGIGIDVVSGGEMYTALVSGFNSENMCLHGNNKDDNERKAAIANKVGRIVADSFEDLKSINEFAALAGTRQKVLIRIKPGVEAHTHEFIKTGQIDSKFGVSIEYGEAMELFRAAKDFENVEIAGIHCHIGSQIFETEPFSEAVKIMLEFMAEVKKEIGLSLYELNLGGGFGIRYTEDDEPKAIKEYLKNSIISVKKYADMLGLERPFIMFEPGRSIVGEAGITVYSVGEIKDIPNVRKYVAVNGGMADNPRYIMYEARYNAVLPKCPDAERTENVTICGKCCESGDLIIKDIMMPEIKKGDYVAVLSTGAYNYSMSSNYNRLLKPPVIMTKNGTSRVIVKRETFEDVVKNDI